MTGPEFAFEVRPRVLTAYAESLHARAADLAAVGEAVAAVPVERDWFGRLPQSGFLADRYAAHQRGVLAEAGELAAWLAAAGLGLAESAGRYSAADRGVAGVAGSVAAALEVGIEIPGDGGSERDASGEPPTGDVGSGDPRSDDAAAGDVGSGDSGSSELASGELASGDGTRG